MAASYKPRPLYSCGSDTMVLYVCAGRCLRAWIARDSFAWYRKEQAGAEKQFSSDSLPLFVLRAAEAVLVPRCSAELSLVAKALRLTPKELFQSNERGARP
jgi:hypothetical protein